jgi:hypothetical protein
MTVTLLGMMICWSEEQERKVKDFTLTILVGNWIPVREVQDWKA